MNYELSVLPRAKRALKTIDKPIRLRIMTAIDHLAEDPRPPGCKKLARRDVWRIRVSDHRALYEIDDQKRMVLVVDVGHRSAIYR